MALVRDSLTRRAPVTFSWPTIASPRDDLATSFLLLLTPLHCPETRDSRLEFHVNLPSARGQPKSLSLDLTHSYTVFDLLLYLDSDLRDPLRSNPRFLESAASSAATASLHHIVCKQGHLSVFVITGSASFEASSLLPLETLRRSTTIRHLRYFGCILGSV